MALPTFQEFMLPTLECFADGNDHSNGEVFEKVAAKLLISGEDALERISTGGRTKSDDRTIWSLVYLTQAGLLESTGRGQRRTTEAGRKLLESRPKKIDSALLRQYPAFQEFEARSKGSSRTAPEGSTETDKAEEQTPEEILEDAFRRAQAPRRMELLDAVLKKSPEFFEKLVLEVLTAVGYGGATEQPTEHLGQSGDGGVDGVIKEDALGLELIYIQAKRYGPANGIGRREIQQFAGSLEGFRARKGVFITTSYFTSEAVQFASKIEKRIALVDGETLVDLMLKHDVGVRSVRNYALKAIDLDYFESV